MRYAPGCRNPNFLGEVDFVDVYETPVGSLVARWASEGDKTIVVSNWRKLTRKELRDKLRFEFAALTTYNMNFYRGTCTHREMADRVFLVATVFGNHNHQTSEENEDVQL